MVKGIPYYELRETRGGKNITLKHLGRDPSSYIATLATSKELIKVLLRYPDLATERPQAVIAEYRRRQMPKVKTPTALFKTIIIDPPWPIEKIQREVRPNQVAMDYPTMTLEEIKDLHLPAAPEGCHIYLWTTQKHLRVAFDVLVAWGVQYQCLLTWVKNVGFTPFSWMYSTEHCLFGHVGNLPLLQMGKRLDFTAKVREHSRKPDEFYDLVRGVSPEPRIDYFSREKREGFEQFGNERERFPA